MSTNEAPKNREDQRDDPSAMWGGESWPPFKGKVAEAKQPKSYRMEIVEGFSGGGTSISTEKWKQWFFEKDKGTNKDETYFEKMTAAIEAWNRLPEDSRADFLSSGDYTDDVDEEMISLLTSSRIIDFADPTPTGGGTGGGGTGGGGGFGGGRGGGHRGPIGGGEGPIGGHRGPVGGGEKPTGGTEGPTGGIEKPGGGVTAGGEEPVDEIEDPVGDEPDNNTGEGEPDNGTGEGAPGDDTGEDNPGDNTNDDPGEGEPGKKPEDKGDGGSPEDDDDNDDGEAEPEDDNKGKKKKRGWGFHWPFGGRKKKKVPEVEPSGSDEEDPIVKKPTPEDPSPTEIIDQIGDNPEISDEEAEKYKVLLVTKLEELPPDEKAEVEKKAKETRKKLLEAGAKGLAALMLLLLLMNPLENVNKPGEVTGTRFETHQEMVEPGHIIHEHKPGEPIIQTIETTSMETIPAEDVEFGDIVELEPGTALRHTSDRRSPNFDIHYTVKEGDELVVNRLAVYDKDGNLIGTRHMSSGDSGKISDMIREIVPEGGEYTLFLHYANPSGGGIDQHQDLGWSDAETVKVEVTTTTTLETPGKDVVTHKFVPPTYENVTTETSFSGEISDSEAGSIEVTNADGSKAIINIRNADDSLVQPGDVVMGDDGCSYQIESSSDAESGIKINALKLAHDIAVVGTGIAAFYVLRRKKKGKGEGVTEGNGEEEVQPAGAEEDGENVEEGEIVETPIFINLTGEQLKGAMNRFTELAGDQADTIAEQFSTEAGMTPERIAELTGEPAEDSIYATMTPAERTVAATLLSHLHEPSSISRLSQLVGVDNYQDFIHSIGINEDEFDINEDDEENPDENTNPEGEEV